MPGKKQFKEQADEGMIRAYYDVVADMELGAGVFVEATMLRTKRKGVMMLVLEAKPNSNVWASGGVVRYTVEWPRSEVATLAAAWFQAVTRLDLMVGQAITADWEPAQPWHEE